MIQDHMDQSGSKKSMNPLWASVNCLVPRASHPGFNLVSRVSQLTARLSKFEPWRETFICVELVFLGKTLTVTAPLSLSLPSLWGNLTNCRLVTCDGLATCPGEVEILLSASLQTLEEALTSITQLAPRLFFLMHHDPSDLGPLILIQVIPQVRS